jgi:diaminopimelate decarboxylase
MNGVGARRAVPGSRAPSFAFDDTDASELAERHGTPAFAYRGSVAEAAFRSLRAVLPPRVRLAYAVKANSHPQLLRRFATLGASFDCASLGELEAVAALGMEPGRVFFAGPGKREAELRAALAAGVRIQAEGWEDLERCDVLAAELGVAELAVNLRVHPRRGVAEERAILGGVGPSAFGVDEEDVPAVLERAANLERLRVRGIHVFAASNERRAQALLDTHRMVFELARHLAERHAIGIEQIDLGGGLGVVYAEEQAPLDLEALGNGLAHLLDEHAWFSGEVILEPGRFLAAACGIYLVRVVRVKISRGAHFAILEGGINHLLRPLLTGEPFPVRRVGAARRAGAAESRRFVLAGPLCTSLDRLGEVELPGDLTAGDLLAFGMTGAYGRSEAMVRFLSHPEASELWVP